MRTRQASTSTRQKCAQAAREAWAKRTEAEKKAIRAKISAGQKRAWAEVKKYEEDEPQDEPEVDYASPW